MPEHMTPSLSDRLRSLSLLLIVLVVVIHAQVPPSRRATPESVPVVPQAVSRFVVTVAGIAVPLFFAISGYLYFADCTGTWAQFGGKLRKRVRSLVIPFLFWSLLGSGAVMVAQRVGTFTSFESPPNMSLGESLLWWVMYPVPHQLWFLRELFALTLLAPVIYFAIRWTGPALGLLALASWLVSYEVFPGFGPEETKVISTRSLAFFTLGAYAALKISIYLERPFPPALPLLAGWVCSCALLGALEAQGQAIPIWVHNVVILVGIAAVWTSYPYLGRLWNARWFVYLTGHTFFIFAAHEPYGQLVKRGLALLLPRSPWAAPAVHLLTVVVVVWLCVIPSAIIRRWWPRAYGFITGGRGRPAGARAAMPTAPERPAGVPE